MAVTRRVFVSGATGFVGRHLSVELASRGCEVLYGARSAHRIPAHRYVQFDLDAPRPVEAAALDGVDTIVHLAGRVHAMAPAENEEQLLSAQNVQATTRLAELAISCAVRRFVFVSSVKVLGEKTGVSPFTNDSTPQPCDPYGRSKLEAERALHRVCYDGPMGVAIVRPPLVYGPGVRANFLALMQAVQAGWPLPIGSISNARSMVSVHNLTDFICKLIEHPYATRRPWLVSDGEDLSTPELVRALARGMGKTARLFPFPSRVLHGIARAVGRGAQFERVCGSLQVDIAETCDALEWRPVISATEAVERTARSFVQD